MGDSQWLSSLRRSSSSSSSSAAAHHSKRLGQQPQRRTLTPRRRPTSPATTRVHQPPPPRLHHHDSPAAASPLPRPLPLPCNNNNNVRENLPNYTIGLGPHDPPHVTDQQHRGDGDFLSALWHGGGQKQSIAINKSNSNNNNVVRELCGDCNGLPDIECRDCDEVYCRGCFATAHSKGRRREHTNHYPVIYHNNNVNEMCQLRDRRRNLEAELQRVIEAQASHAQSVAHLQQEMERIAQREREFYNNNNNNNNDVKDGYENLIASAQKDLHRLQQQQQLEQQQQQGGGGGVLSPVRIGSGVRIGGSGGGGTPRLPLEPLAHSKNNHNNNVLIINPNKASGIAMMTEQPHVRLLQQQQQQQGLSLGPMPRIF
eukprot:PhM_4_TR16122/c1_g2_i1/m.101342